MLLKRSGRPGNPAAIAMASTRKALVSAMAVVPVAGALAVLISPWFLVSAAVPVAFAAAPEVRLRDMVAQRREGVERELPFFAMLVSVLGSAGVPLYSIVRDVAGNDSFRWIGREAQLVKRDVEILGMNAIESFERLASSHPSKRFGEFLLGYASKVRSGGDVPFYVVSESGSLLRGLEDGWAIYASRVGIIGSMMVTVFGVVPLLLMVVGIFSPGFSIVGLVVFTGLAVPLFTIGLLFMTGRMQPMGEDPAEGKVVRSLLVALPGLALGVLTDAPWVAVAAFLFVFFVAFGLSVKEQMEEAKGVDEGTSLFLKDLLEYKRQEYDLARAMVAIEAQGGYNRRFARILSRVAAKLKAGVPLDEVEVESRSRVGRISFLLLGQMSRSGGGTVDTLYQASHFADRLLEMKRRARSEIRPYILLSHLSPVMLAIGVAFVGGVLSSFSRTVTPGLSDVHLAGVQIGTIPPALSEVSDLLIVVSAAALGLIGAKVTDLTVRNTLRASTNVAIAIAAIVAMAAVGSHSPSALLAR